MSTGWVAPTGAVPKRQNLPTPLNASGAGTGQIVNNNSAAVWVIVSLSVITAPTSSGCTCTFTPPTGIINTSYFAGTGDLFEGPHFLYHGDSINVSYVNGPINGQGLITYEFYEIPL